MKIKPVVMTYENFMPYGTMLSHPEQSPDIAGHDLDYWKLPMKLGNFTGNGELSFMRVKRRDIATGMLDMLPESAELYLSLDGGASVYFVAPPAAGDEQKPDIGKIKAFLYSGPGGVLVNPGIWHWTPFPLSHDADFFLGLRNNVLIEEDGAIKQGENQVVYYELKEELEVEL